MMVYLLILALFHEFSWKETPHKEPSLITSSSDKKFCRFLLKRCWYYSERIRLHCQCLNFWNQLDCCTAFKVTPFATCSHRMSFLLLSACLPKSQQLWPVFIVFTQYAVHFHFRIVSQLSIYHSFLETPNLWKD